MDSCGRKCETFIAVHAVLRDGVIDTTGKSSGVLASPISRKENPDQSAYTTFELFSGGFSGWAHVLRRLTELGYNFCHRLAVDFDAICAESLLSISWIFGACGTREHGMECRHASRTSFRGRRYCGFQVVSFTLR